MIDYVLRVLVEFGRSFGVLQRQSPQPTNSTQLGGLCSTEVAEKVVVPGDIAKSIAMTAPGSVLYFSEDDPVSEGKLAGIFDSRPSHSSNCTRKSKICQIIVIITIIIERGTGTLPNRKPFVLRLTRIQFCLGLAV